MNDKKTTKIEQNTKMKKYLTDFEIGQGMNRGKMFQISESGKVYRRRPATIDDYGCYGQIAPEKDTEENREKLLKILRAERNGKGANRKQTVEIVKKFNEQ